MGRLLNSFKILKDGKLLDYRLGEDLDLDKVRSFFEQSYHIEKIQRGARHILGILSKDNKTYFLKLSTSEGISVVTRNEYNWNTYSNKYLPENRLFSVPKNYDKGSFRRKYFYLITNYFEGEPLCNIGEDDSSLISCIPQIIEVSKVIQKLPGKEGDYLGKFVSKTKGWFDDIPSDVIKEYNIKELFQVVAEGMNKLDSKPRHGDFAPWHIVKLQGGKLGLIDGEHALPDGVENYDICYFIQRVFSVLKHPKVAMEIYDRLIKRGYSAEKLKIVLAARAVGGFLDESLGEKPDYKIADQFKNWVLNI